MGSLLASNVQLPPQQSTNIGPTINSAQGGINTLANTYGGLGGSVLPQAQATAQNLYNNPYAGQALSGAQGAAGYGTGAAGAQYGTGAGLLPYAQSILQTGFDPQQQLYNQLYAQNQAQSAVNAANAGVASSPYGVGLMNQSGQNFNIDWQNQQLGRQLQAAQGAGALDQLGTNLMAQAPTTLAQTSAIPYATYSDIGQGQNQALSQLLGIGQSGANLSNMPIQDLLGLLSGQNQANQVANQTAQLGLNQSQLGFDQLGTLLSGGAGILGAVPGLGFLGGGFNPGNAGFDPSV